MKVSKKLLSVVLAFALLLGAAAVGTFTASADGETYSAGETLFYGTYPQSRVTDENLIEALNESIIEIEWMDYGYYTGTGNDYDGRMAPAELMSYQDIVLSNVKYRGVKIDAYRPDYTSGTSAARNTMQDDYGYSSGKVYWFAFEPLKWTVLEPSLGLVVCTYAVDSQAYNDFIVKNGSQYWGNPEKTYYANDYAESSIRTWLNTEFIRTAFSSEQQENIKESMLNNDCPDNHAFNAASTQDKIFLLSYTDVKNSDLGFSSDDDRLISATDYAKCQGAYVNDGSALWWLRTPDSSSECAYFITVTGSPEYSLDVNETDLGIRPAMALTTLVSDPTGAPLHGGVGYIGDEPTGLPKLRINAETNFWEVSYDEGATWNSLNIKATGEDGQTGPAGNGIDSIEIDSNKHLIVKLTDGTVKDLGEVNVTNVNVTVEGGASAVITPKLRINTETNFWEVSYDDGANWTSLNVTATGKTGNTPKLRINDETNFWEVSYNDGVTWESLDIKATGENGIDGTDGENGVGIATTELSRDGELIITLTNGRTFNLGKVTGEKGEDGADGKDGVSVVSMQFNDKGELVITMSDGTEINAGKPSGSAYDAPAAKPAVVISGYQANRSVDYGTSITFHASVDFIPEGYELHWFVNGEDKGTSDTLTVNNASGNFTVCARLMKDGSTISESAVEKVNVKADFFSRIIAFFKKLLNKNAFVIDQI